MWAELLVPPTQSRSLSLCNQINRLKNKKESVFYFNFSWNCSPQSPEQKWVISSSACFGFTAWAAPEWNLCRMEREIRRRSNFFKKRHAAPSNILFRSPTLTCSASDWLASVSPVCTLRYRLYLAVSSRSAAPGVVWWKNPAFPGFSAFIFMDVGRVLWWRNLNVFITRHSVITCREDVFTAAALTYSSSVEMYIQAEPGRVEPARVWRSSERIVP